MPINLAALGAEGESKPADDFAKRLAKQLVAGKSREELLTLAGAFVKQQVDEAPTTATTSDSPKTPDELWDYIHRNWGVKIARVAVCDGHDAPFDFICLGFFETVPNLFSIGPRGGGKSYATALLMELNSRLKPGCESMVFGAVDEQNRKVYQDMAEHFINGGLPDGESEIIGEPLASLVQYVNGSRVKSAPGTKAKMNGQHPPKAHGEEIEIFNPEAYKESQPVDTMIPTPHGWRRFGDLEVGDVVFTRDGSATTVNKIVDYGEYDVFKVRLTDGRDTYCCGDHLWSVATTFWSRDRDKWKTVRTSEMAERGLKLPTSYRYTLPHAKPVDFQPGTLLIHPYIMGVVLGDGHIGRSSVDFASCDDHIAEKVAGLLPDRYVLSTRETRPEKYAREDKIYKRYLIRGRQVVHVGTMHDAFSSYGLAGARSQTKFIPEAYKTTSRLERLELLRGLLDTDGCAIEGSSVAEYATTSERMARDVREVVFSLGGRAILRSKHYETEISSGMLYTLDISFGDGTMPFSLPRKMERMTTRQRTLHPSVKSIEPAGRAHVRCIGVDASDATYLTNDFIVTHNSRNMAADKIMRDGSVIKAQNFGTSTRKWKNGRVDKIFQSFLKAKDAALVRFNKVEVDEEVREHITITSPWYCVIYCIFEIAAPVYECREAPENRDRPDAELCRCNQVVNGSWDRDGNDPRTLASVCRGRLYRSRGHRSYGEVVQLFLQNDQGTWEAQQECIDTETEGLYIPNFSRRRHGLARFSLDVANGPIYSGTDWGFTDEAAVVWVQYLERPVEAIGYDGETRVLPRGSRVAFAELTIAQKTATELGQLAIVREVKLANVMSIKRAPVRKRWADIQGAGDRRDWAKMGLKTARYSTRNFDEHVKEWRGLVDADRFFVVVDSEEFTGMGCPFLCDQLEGWREEEGKESRKQPQHVVSAGRYVLYGMHDIYMDSGAQSPEQTEARKLSQGDVSAPAAVAYTGPSAYGDRELMQAEADWRARV